MLMTIYDLWLHCGGGGGICKELEEVQFAGGLLCWPAERLVLVAPHE